MSQARVFSNLGVLLGALALFGCSVVRSSQQLGSEGGGAAPPAAAAADSSTAGGASTQPTRPPAQPTRPRGAAAFLISIGVLGVGVASSGLAPLSLSSLEVVGLMAAVGLVYGGLGMATAVGTIMLAQGKAREIESSDARPAIEGSRSL